MLNIDEIQTGIVIDHITAGTAMKLYQLLDLESLQDASVAIIQNVRSRKSGKKDIIKIEGDVSGLNLNVAGYLDANITIAIIEDGKLIRKERPVPPKRLVNVIKCSNPRCISGLEEECDQIFELSPNGKYRCLYCEQEFQVKAR